VRLVAEVRVRSLDANLGLPEAPKPY
jgi:hypothetical protein